MDKQRGVALSGLLIWGVIIAIVALLGIKVAPEVIDYYKIKKGVTATAANANGKTVAEIRPRSITLRPCLPLISTSRKREARS